MQVLTAAARGRSSCRFLAVSHRVVREHTHRKQDDCGQVEDLYFVGEVAHNSPPAGLARCIEARTGLSPFFRDAFQILDASRQIVEAQLEFLHATTRCIGLRGVVGFICSRQSLEKAAKETPVFR